MSEEIFVNGEHRIGLGQRLTSDMTPESINDARNENWSPRNDYSCYNRQRKLLEYEKLIIPRRKEEYRSYRLSCVLKIVAISALVIITLSGVRCLGEMVCIMNSMDEKLGAVAAATADEQPAVDLGGVRSDLSGISDAIKGLADGKDAMPADADTPAVSDNGVWVDIEDDGRGWIGLTVTDGVAQSEDGTEGFKGALIVDVLKGSPAMSAGIRENDMIIAIDGNPVEGRDDFLKHLTGKKPGDKAVILTISNGAYKPEEHEVTLVAFDELDRGTAGGGK